MALMLGLVSITLISCGNFGSNNSNTSTQNVNIKVSESTDGWEKIGVVEVAYDGYYNGGKNPTPKNNGEYKTKMGMYVKMVGGEKYYGIAQAKDTPMSFETNPFYGKNNDYSGWHGYKYRVHYYDFVYYYFNF